MLFLMKVHLRDADTHDAHRIAEIYLSGRKKFLSYAPLAHSDVEIRHWIKGVLIPSNGVSVALVESEIIGFSATSKNGDCGWIDQLYIDPSIIGGGIGSLFVERIKETLGPPIRLYTFQQNEGARRFYLRHQFRELELTDGSGNEEKTPDVLMEWP